MAVPTARSAGGRGMRHAQSDPRGRRVRVGEDIARPDRSDPQKGQSDMMYDEGHNQAPRRAAEAQYTDLAAGETIAALAKFKRMRSIAAELKRRARIAVGMLVSLAVLTSVLVVVL